MFNIAINPFTQVIVVTDRQNNSVELTYKDVDQWDALKINGKKYDIHILYDEGLNISMYEVINNKANYNKIIPIKVKVIY